MEQALIVKQFNSYISKKTFNTIIYLKCIKLNKIIFLKKLNKN